MAIWPIVLTFPMKLHNVDVFLLFFLVVSALVPLYFLNYQKQRQKQTFVLKYLQNDATSCPIFRTAQKGRTPSHKLWNWVVLWPAEPQQFYDTKPLNPMVNIAPHCQGYLLSWTMMAQLSKAISPRDHPHDLRHRMCVLYIMQVGRESSLLLTVCCVHYMDVLCLKWFNSNSFTHYVPQSVSCGLL